MKQYLFVLAFLSLVVPSALAGERPNILLLLAEDLSPDIGAYGHEVVHTPNLDQLAREGVRYTEVFATSSVCSPSRSAIYTGVYQTSIDSHQHRNLYPKPLPRGYRILTQIFSDAGYFVFNGTADDLSESGKIDVNFIVPPDLFDGTDWRQRADGQPFFGIVQFEETHRDFEGDPHRPIPGDIVTPPPFYPDHPLARRDWADYLEDVQILDRKVGKILDRLEADGLEDTLVIFFSDHGRPMPRCKQFLYDGGLHIPLIARWPGQLPEDAVDTKLLSTIDILPSCVAAAGLTLPAGLDGKPLLFSVDEGRSYVFAARDRCGEAADRIRMVRSKDWKLLRNFHPTRPYTVFSAYKEIQYPMLHLMRMLYQNGSLTAEQATFMEPTRPFEELYQIEQDPHEIRNIVNQPEHAVTRQELATVLDEWIEVTDDAGRIPEDYRKEVQWYQKNQRWYEQTLIERNLLGNDTPAAHVQYWTGRLME